MFPKNNDSLMQVQNPTSGSPAKRTRIAIKARGKILFIDPSEVLTVEAQGNYVLLRRASGSEFLRELISTVAEKLQPLGFVRIHRSVIVNSSFVEEIRPNSDGDYVLCMKGGRKFAISRTYRSNLHFLSPTWIGTTGFSAS